MKLWKIATLGVATLGIFWLGSEGYNGVSQSPDWKRVGEKMSQRMEEYFIKEREDVVKGMNSNSREYVDKYGYGIAMPRTPWQEEYFKKFGVKVVSIKTKKGEKLSDIAKLLYKDSGERMNFQFLNPNTVHYDPNAPLLSGLEIKVYMLPGQISQYKIDFPEREICVIDENKQRD